MFVNIGLELSCQHLSYLMTQEAYCSIFVYRVNPDKPGESVVVAPTAPDAAAAPESQPNPFQQYFDDLAARGGKEEDVVGSVPSKLMTYSLDCGGQSHFSPAWRQKPFKRVTASMVRGNRRGI